MTLRQPLGVDQPLNGSSSPTTPHSPPPLLYTPPLRYTASSACNSQACNKFFNVVRLVRAIYIRQQQQQVLPVPPPPYPASPCLAATLCQSADR